MTTTTSGRLRESRTYHIEQHYPVMTAVVDRLLDWTQVDGSTTMVSPNPLVHPQLTFPCRTAVAWTAVAQLPCRSDVHQPTITINMDSPATDDNADDCVDDDADCVDDDADVVDEEADVDGEEPWLGYGWVGGASTTWLQVCGLLLPSSTSRADQNCRAAHSMLALASMVRFQSPTRPALDDDGTSTCHALANSTLPALTQAQGPCHSAEGDYHGGWIAWEDHRVVATGTGHVSRRVPDIRVVVSDPRFSLALKWVRSAQDPVRLQCRRVRVK